MRPEILPMGREPEPSKDLVYHTLKHFMGNDAWIPRPPAKAADPAACLAALEALGVRLADLLPDRDGLPAPRAYKAPCLEVVLEAHDEGYCPRYLDGAATAGPPGVPGSLWVPNGKRKGRLCAVVGGMKIVVQLEASRPLAQVVTAYLTPGWTPSAPTSGLRNESLASALAGLVAMRAAQKKKRRT